MARKKSIKRNSKRQKTNNKLVSVQKMEMELMQAPSKMLTQIEKEVRANKKQEKKLAKAVHKVNAQVKKAKNRVKSAAGKTQLKVARKKLEQAANIQTVVNKQLQAASQSIDGLLQTQSRYMALEKYLSQFNAEWIKASKKAKKLSKPKTAGKKTKAKAKLASVNQLSQSVETGMDNATLDEVTELAS